MRDAKPVDGVQTIKVRKGDRARFEIRSPDTSDEIHVHGYDLYGNVTPDRAARFSFEAEAEGIFEVELHGSGEQIAELRVEPK